MAPDWKVLGIIAVVTLVVAGFVGTQMVGKPRVESVDNDWGNVTSERTEVETHIAVNNPALLRLGDAVANVEYTVSLNDVTMATGEKKEVDLNGQENTVNVSTWINNDDIPDWWVSHVRNNETTTVRVNPDVTIDGIGGQISAAPYTRTRTFQTDILAPLQTNESRRFSVNGQTLLVVEETDASWGNVTSEQTPIDISMTVRNALPLPLPVEEVNYTIRMNGVAVGNGTAFQDEALPPSSTQQLEAQAVIDNSKLDEWWVTHVRNNETTQMTVDLNASVSYGGETIHLPADIAANKTFQTNIFPNESRAR